MTSNTQVLEAVAGVSARKVVANILATYAKATEANKVDGANWYPYANQIATDFANTYGVSLECATAVIAHMSPRLHWVKNVAYAGVILSGGTPKALGTSIRNCQRAMNSDDPISTLNGPKVKAFAANILGDTNAVTIDVWALRIAFGDIEINDNWLKRKGFYDAVANCYRIAANRLGIDPSTLQAITWVTIRNGRAG